MAGTHDHASGGETSAPRQVLRTATLQVYDTFILDIIWGSIMATERLTISLTPELLDFIRKRTADGDYNNDSEVIREALRLLKERDQAVTRWLNEQVVPAYVNLKANPGSALTREQSEAKLEERRRQRRSTKKAAA